MSKSFTESQRIAEFEAEFGSLFCAPPAVKTESVQGLAALADPGQAGRTLSPLQRFAFVRQFRNPAGFWVRACDAEILPRRFAEIRRA